MIIKCIYNTGKVLLKYPRMPIGTSEITQFGELTIGEKYLVMGMMLIEGYLLFLIDSGRVISACPYQLFKIIDDSLPYNWLFKSFTIEEQANSHFEAVWGYKELCYDETHYEKLIDMDEEAVRKYFDRKKETESALSTQALL